MGRCALILASGTGSRAGGGLPKQFRDVGGVPMVMWSVMAFAKMDPLCRIVLVIHQDYKSFYSGLRIEMASHMALPEVELCTGGATRIDSVRNGLELVGRNNDDPENTFVAVHDAARPMVTPQIISDSFLTAERERCVAVPAVAVADSLRELSGGMDGRESNPVERSRFVAVQTPQTAPLSWFLDAYGRVMRPDFTDDASILQSAGYRVTLFDSSPVNMKVTYPSDFVVADVLLRSRI